MLDSVNLTNFKAARNLSIPVAPLTLFAGMNGSGKSTVLQCLAAIRQSYQNGHGHALQLGGPLIRLGQGIDILSEGARDENITLSVTENGIEYLWICESRSDSNQLKFIEAPSTPHAFVSSPNFQYLQADRIVPHTLYPQADQQAEQLGFLGSHGEFTVDFLARNGERLVSEKRRFLDDDALLDKELWAHFTPTAHLLNQVAGWLQQISPGAHLQATYLKGTDEVSLQFRYIGTTQGRTRSYRPTHVGFGLTYSLPILVACLAAQPGSLLLIENPEAHLHPQGQAKLGELLALCAADGVQVLVETHSDHVLNGIRLAVKDKRGGVTAEDVRLCYFTRDISSGDCYVELPTVLADGQLSNWPKGFFDQWEKSLNALLD